VGSPGRLRCGEPGVRGGLRDSCLRPSVTQASLPVRTGRCCRCRVKGGACCTGAFGGPNLAPRDRVSKVLQKSEAMVPTALRMSNVQQGMSNFQGLHAEGAFNAMHGQEPLRAARTPSSVGNSLLDIGHSDQCGLQWQRACCFCRRFCTQPTSDIPCWLLDIGIQPYRALPQRLLKGQ
jgi:hypothetical protein